MVAFFLMFMANLILALLAIRMVAVNFPDTGIGRAAAFIH